MRIPKLLHSLATLCLLLLLLTFTALPIAIAQETTGGIEGTVKDPSGATVSRAVVLLTGDKLIGTKTVTTDGTGYYRFTNLAPGAYTLSVIVPGFNELRREGISIQVGRLPTIDMVLSVGSDTTIVEVNATTPQIDITQSHTQTNVTRDELDYAPRGRSFQDAIAFAPGARNEPLQNGYQIDGGATSENAYLINGMDTGSMVTGKSAANAPFEFIQEVQIKTSGIDAEHGGALGGVVNAIQKQGSNALHGSVFAYYEGDPMDARPSVFPNPISAPNDINANPGSYVRYDPNGTYSTATRTDYVAQIYTPTKDHFRIVQPGVEVGGYLKKDRLWFELVTAPQFTTTRRQVNFTSPACTAAGNCSGLRQFNFSEQTYYSLVRLDYKATDKIRLFAAWQYGYDKLTGTSMPNAESRDGLFNASINNPVDSYQGAIGSVSPNNVFTTGADITINSNMVATTRFGQFYQNYGDRGLPVGDRYLFTANTSTTTPGLDGTTLGAAYPNAAGKATNNYTIGPNLAYLYNVNSRTSFSQDLAYFKKGFFGTHNLKFGYQLNHLYENVNQSFTNDLVRVGYTTYGTQTTTGAANCAAIVATNTTKYGKPGGSSSSCQGNWGYVAIRDGVEITGKASSNNHSLYVQDSWTLGKGITANVGLRIEKEYLPAYNQYPSGISFGFGKKIAPRLGASWDVFQNGKVKAFGSYGVFYDLMKLNLAIGSFGGNYWHDCVYALDTADYSIVKPIKDATGHYCPKGGATTGANFGGGTTPAGLRFIENVDFRIPSNDPSQGAAVDPALNPYRQHEAVGGIDYQISRSFAFESRYSRRRLDHAIEDIGYIGPDGEAFIIANPGEGFGAGGATINCPTCKIQPKAARNYDAIEFRLTKVASSHWFGQFAYTYSKLRGNYSGLTSTDISDAGGARANPNNNRAFDEPYLQFDASGNSANGLLGTDRPNSFKGIVYYRLNVLKKNEVSLSLFQQASSGSPLSSFADVNGSTTSYPTYVVGRGKWIDVTRNPADGAWVYGNTYVRRTPWYIQSDVSLTDSYKISSAHEGWRLGFEANFTNLFNQKSATQYSSRINAATGSTGNYILPPGSTAGNPNYGILENGYDWKSIANSTSSATRGPLVLSSLYGQPSAFQTGRSIRLKFKFTF